MTFPEIFDFLGYCTFNGPTKKSWRTSRGKINMIATSENPWNFIVNLL